MNIKKRGRYSILDRKSQITLLIILALVMFIVLIFAYYIVHSTTISTIEEQVDEVTTEVLEKTAVKYYVNTCLDYASKKGLRLIGEQGGFIFREQPGSIIDWDIPYAEFQGRNVSFQIYSLLSGQHKPISSLTYMPPYYPCYTSHEVNLNLVGEVCYKAYTHTQTSFLFGTKSEPIPSLCKENIAEIPGYRPACGYLNEINRRYSIQAQLENFIAYNTKQCVNFSSFKSYDASVGEITANVSFGNEDVDIKINFPIIVTLKGEEPVTKFLSFYSKQNIRFKDIYEISRDIIDKDLNNISFDIKRDGQNYISREHAGFSIHNHDFPSYNIIVINDSLSREAGKPYQFMFAIENRYPALDYYDRSSNPDLEIYAIEGEDIVIEPLAYDPDEDNLLYKYEGWKADWDDDYEDAMFGNTPFTGIGWKDSDTYNDESLCIHPVTNEETEKRCASYTTTRADIGFHNITINATDPFGYHDYQLIRILVDDKPNIVLRLDNMLSGIPNNIASIEDPFILNASRTTDIFTRDQLLYSWAGYNINEGYNQAFFLDFSDRDTLILPRENYDITDMSEAFDTPGLHEIHLSVKDSGIEGAVIERIEQVHVYTCIPYRSNTPPYPFNSFGEQFGGYESNDNPFLGSHSCCSGDINNLDNIELANENTVCFDAVDYGCLGDFQNSDSSANSILPGAPTEHITDDIAYPEERNDVADIYRREIIRKCDGNRGNICGGDYEIRLIYESSCQQEEGTAMKCMGRAKNLDLVECCQIDMEGCD